MQLFVALGLLTVAGAASFVDVVRQSRANPGQKIPWLGNPPRMPKWWILPRLVMVLSIMGGINLLWGAAGIAPWIASVVPVVAIAVPAICVLIAHNRHVKDVEARPTHEEVAEIQR